MTVKDWVLEAKLRLADAGIEAAGLEAQLLAAHVLLVDRTWLIAHSADPFPELAGESLLQRRLGHEPLAYILGYREFFGRRFVVRPGVLIPRQETEVLIEATIKAVQNKKAEILDLGTGSGCIAITLKLEEPSWTVRATDISSRALDIAKENAGDLGAQVEFAEADGFDGFSERVFDAIVTNPPYIGLEESLSDEVQRFEPREALFSGLTGMEFYERLAKEAKANLKRGGHIVMEVGYKQAKAVALLFENEGWNVLDTVRDLAGIPRVVICTT